MESPSERGPGSARFTDPPQPLDRPGRLETLNKYLFTRLRFTNFLIGEMDAIEFSGPSDLQGSLPGNFWPSQPAAWAVVLILSFSPSPKLNQALNKHTLT